MLSNNMLGVAVFGMENSSFAAKLLHNFCGTNYPVEHKKTRDSSVLMKYTSVISKC